jgi:acylpyruvate hydrolase
MWRNSVFWIVLCFSVVLFSSNARALRLVTYVYDGEMRIGAVIDNKVIDLNRAYQALLTEQGEPRPEAMAQAIVPPSMVDFLAGEERSMKAAKDALAFVQKQRESMMRREGITKDLKAVQLKAPIPRPTKITLMGFNYRAHAAEMLEKVPEHPLLFSAYPTAVNGPGAPIVIARGSEKPDYEAEFGVVIGKRGRYVPADKAMDHVAGYLIVNDSTDRAWQRRSSQYLIGKSIDSMKVMGPYLVTKDEISDPHKLAIKLWVNGDLRQNSNTELQVFRIWDVISYMSTFWTLEPGDVLSTGTPVGVGHKRKPPVYLKHGDRVRIEISGLGVLENPVTADGRSARN